MRGRAIVGLTTACEALVGPALARAQVMSSPFVAPVYCRFDQGMRVVDAGCVGDSLGVERRRRLQLASRKASVRILAEKTTPVLIS